MSLAAGLAAELAGCACAATGAAAARLPAASMPCRKPRRSFVLEFMVVLALVYANGLYDNYATSRCLMAFCPLLLWAGPRIHQVALYQVRIPNSYARRQAPVHQRLRPQGYRREVPHHAEPHALQREPLRCGELQDLSRSLREVRSRTVHLRLPEIGRASCRERV